MSVTSRLTRLVDGITAFPHIQQSKNLESLFYTHWSSIADKCLSNVNDNGAIVQLLKALVDQNMRMENDQAARDTKISASLEQADGKLGNIDKKFSAVKTNFDEQFAAVQANFDQRLDIVKDSFAQATTLFEHHGALFDCIMQHNKDLKALLRHLMAQVKVLVEISEKSRNVEDKLSQSMIQNEFKSALNNYFSGTCTSCPSVDKFIEASFRPHRLQLLRRIGLLIPYFLSPVPNTAMLDWGIVRLL
jgi:hypothetical protein